MAEIICGVDDLRVGDLVLAWRGTDWPESKPWAKTPLGGWLLDSLQGSYWRTKHNIVIAVPNEGLRLRVVRQSKRSDLVRLLGMSVE